MRIAVPLVLMLLLLPFADAGAAVRCIESVIQVQPMLDAALASGEALEEVRIKQGNFFFTTGNYGYFGVLQGTDKTLTISGGWSGPAGQCTTQDGAASSTVFWGMGERRVFSINASATFTGTVVVQNMTFGGGYGTGNTAASCVSLAEQNGGLMAIRIERVRVEACTSTSTFDAPIVSLTTGAGLILRNSLIAGNAAGVSPPLTIAVRGGAGFVLNNTIANNTTANINGYTGISASASNGISLTLANNIFDGNVSTAASRTDVRVATGVTLVNNRFTGLAGVPVSNTGSSTGAAGFGDSDYGLARTSTARDAGAFYAPLLQGTLDLNGKPRIVGAAVDLGAVEYSGLLQDGFEGS